MSIIDSELRERLLGAFRGESIERMRVLSSDLMKLEKESDDKDKRMLIESSYRELHSLKGAARAVGLGAVEKFCQSFESFFSVVKKKQLTPSKSVCSQMLGWLDILDKILVQEDGTDGDLSTPPIAMAISKMEEFAKFPNLIVENKLYG